MPQFKYTALDLSGRELSAQLEASSENEAMAMLSEKSLTVVELSLIQGGRSGAEAEAEKRGSSIWTESGIPMPTILNFYEQLSFLLNAGIPLHLCVRMAITYSKHPTLVRILKKILFDITEGSTLSSAINRFPKYFPLLHTQIIAVGEKTGTLDKSLVELGEVTRERMEIEARAIKAASYPLFLVTMSLCLGLGMVMFVFPKFQEIFSSFDNKLPLLTSVLMDVSVMMRDNTATIFGVLGAVIGGGAFFFLSPALTQARETFFLTLPLINDIFISMFVSQFSKTLSGTLKSGIPLFDALIICRQTVPEGKRRNFIKQMIDAVQEGQPLSEAMEKSEFVPELVWQLTAIGEKSGNLPVIMDSIFSFYKKRYDALLTKITAIMQPVLMFSAAAFIGVMAAALFIPLFKMGTNIKRPE